MGAGGAERVAATLVNFWANRGDDVILMPTFSGRGECFYDISPKVQVIYLADLIPSARQNIWGQFLRLKALRCFISTQKADVIISFLPKVNIAAVLASGGLKIPVVICDRTDPFIMPISIGLRLACNFVYAFASRLVVQTHAVAEKYRNSSKYLPHITVIGNPIPEIIKDSKKKVLRVTENKTLLAIGRLSEEKGFSALINAFAELAPIHYNWSLRIVGEGSLRFDLQKQIERLGLLDRIKLAGRKENIVDELVVADAFALTSKFEGFPNALLEAMSVGLPCLTVNCPSGPKEISEDGNTALLVDAGDPTALVQGLNSLFSSSKLRNSLGKKGRDSVNRRFNLSTITNQWDQLFSELEIKLKK